MSGAAWALPPCSQKTRLTSARTIGSAPARSSRARNEGALSAARSEAPSIGCATHDATLRAAVATGAFCHARPPSGELSRWTPERQTPVSGDAVHAHGRVTLCRRVPSCAIRRRASCYPSWMPPCVLLAYELKTVTTAD
eukprot:2630254-Prymnesium_polylepis.1